MTNFEARWQVMKAKGEADFVVQWGLLRVGGFLIAISGVAAIFDLLSHDLLSTLIGFSIHVLESFLIGTIIGTTVWKWYEHSAKTKTSGLNGAPSQRYLSQSAPIEK